MAQGRTTFPTRHGIYEGFKTTIDLEIVVAQISLVSAILDESTSSEPISPSTPSGADHFAFGSVGYVVPGAKGLYVYGYRSLEVQTRLIKPPSFIRSASSKTLAKSGMSVSPLIRLFGARALVDTTH